MNWKKIFDSWEVAREKLPENIPVLLKIGSNKISLVRRNNDIFAFSALCPHQNDPLYKGKINTQGEVICPLHKYRYNLKTGKECLERTEDMNTYPIKIDSSVYIALND